MSRFMLLALLVVVLFASGRVLAADEAAEDWWGFHGQTTFVTQYHPGFHSAFRGPNSLDPQAQAREPGTSRSTEGCACGGGLNCG
jgi:hypothetical protein